MKTILIISIIIILCGLLALFMYWAYHAAEIIYELLKAIFKRKY